MEQTGRIGFRIVTGAPRPPPEVVEAFRGMASSNVGDAMGRFHFMDPGVVARSGLPVSGPAVTVSCRPGDNLMVHKALEIAEAGDVVVVSTNGNTTSAVFGELMCRSARAPRVGGIVVDGAIRDADVLAELGFPTFSRTVSPGACDKDGPGEINVPVSCGNAVVMPGDIVVGDADVVVVVPRQDAAEVLERVRALIERERGWIQAMDGVGPFKAEIDRTLRAKDVIP